jgi:hypothetical protein
MDFEKFERMEGLIRELNEFLNWFTVFEDRDE